MGESVNTKGVAFAKNAAPLVVLGAGYAGLTVAQGVWHRTRGKIPIILVDRHPVHVLRTELYEVGEIASEEDARHWTVPLDEIFDQTGVECREATVQGIDMAAQVVRTTSSEIPYGTLALCLGNVGAYYGVPGATENAHQVYGLLGAQRLARSLRQVELESTELRGERRPRFVVIGGGSTGTELAADIATTDWRRFTSPDAHLPEVVLVTGSLPFLAGLPTTLIRHARALLREAGVNLILGVNTTAVEPKRVILEDGTVLACDVAVWCAGVEAPPLIRGLPVPHGKGGRITVTPRLEVPGFPGVYAVGDVAEVKDARSGMPIPQTAQAAVEEAKTAAENIVARCSGRPTRPFVYRENGVILAMGQRRGAATVRHFNLSGRSASWLKKMVEREYVREIKQGEPSALL
jgi:NADH:ubiquinone reductase (H+-translocating)